MASLEQHPKSDNFHLRFRFDSRSYRRSLKADNTIEAEAILARVREMMRLIERGRIEVPQEVDVIDFVLSDGKTKTPDKQRRDMSLAKLFDIYQAGLRSQHLPNGSLFF